MKIATTHNYKTKLLRLKLLKTKIYRNQENFDYLLLKEMETRLKKILHVIYRFHVANKKILFIGTPLKLNNQIKQLLKNKKHSFIPESVWMNGIITNSSPSFKHLLKKHAVSSDKVSKSLFNLKNQSDLVVVLNEKLNLDALEESALRRVPTISLNSNHNLPSTYLSTYKLSGDFSFAGKEIRNNLFFLFLNSLLKKAEIFKKKQIKRNVKKKKSELIEKKWNRFNHKKNVSSKKK
jgi:hypothetical protein